LPVHRIIEPATTQAHEGLLINSIQAKYFQVVDGIYMSTPESRALFASKDDTRKLIGEGEVFTNVAFADAMDAIAHEGEYLFYRGDISAMIDADCQVGGALRRRDLENYKIFRRDPITREYRGAKFISNPPPSSGGLLILFALALLDDFGFFNKKFGSLKYLQDLAQVMELTDQAQTEIEIHHVNQTKMHDTLFAPELVEKYRADVLGTPSAFVALHISVLLMQMVMQRH
jgi:gamma-glutamyltranspeptidase/glutathione hydrolase